MERIERQRKIDLILKTLNNEAQLSKDGIIAFEPVIIKDAGKYFTTDGKEILDLEGYSRKVKTEKLIILPAKKKIEEHD